METIYQKNQKNEDQNQHLLNLTFENVKALIDSSIRTSDMIGNGETAEVLELSKDVINMIQIVCNEYNYYVPSSELKNIQQECENIVERRKLNYEGL